MLNHPLVSIAVAAILGTLAGLGVGGGSLLILWLTLVLGRPPQTARGINLLFFLPSAAISCWFRWKQGAVRPKAILPAIVSGCAAAAVFSFVAAGLDRTILEKLFGILLIATGIRELCCRPKR